MPERKRATPGLEVVIPGRKRPLKIKHAVIDFNGTLAVDGRLVRGVASRLRKLAHHLDIVVMTADTFGTARRSLSNLPVTVRIVHSGVEKRRFVESIDGATVAAIGNGVNDVPMLRVAALGIAIIGNEGAAGEALGVAHIVVRDINDALDLLLTPKRLVATLRS